MASSLTAALVVPSRIDPGDDKLTEAGQPLAPIAGKSVAGWIVDAALGASIRRVALVSADVDAATRSELIGRSDGALIEFVQPRFDLADTLSLAIERLGPELTLREAAHVLVLPAECPLLRAADLRRFVSDHVASGAAATVGRPDADPVGAVAPVETVVRRDDQGELLSIAEVPTNSAAVLCVRASLLVPALRRLTSLDWERGVPIVEIAGVLADAGHRVRATELMGLFSIGSMSSRASVEMTLRDRVIAGWLDRGVSIPDPRQVSIDATVTLGQGVQVLPGTVLEGTTVVGDGATIGPNTHLRDASIGCAAVVPHAVVVSGEIDAHVEVVPFTVSGDQLGRSER